MTFADSPSSMYAGSRPRGSAPCAKVMVKSPEPEPLPLASLARFEPQPTMDANALEAVTVAMAFTNILRDISALLDMGNPLPVSGRAAATPPLPHGEYFSPRTVRLHMSATTLFHVLEMFGMLLNF